MKLEQKNSQDLLKDLNWAFKSKDTASILRTLKEVAQDKKRSSLQDWQCLLRNYEHTHTSEGPVNHRLGGVRKCRGLFEVKLSWHEVHTSRHNRGSLSRPIIPTSNKWRATSWRVLVALILFILPFMRTFLLHLMAPVKYCSTVLEDTDI